jgi:hypothetical protein
VTLVTCTCSVCGTTAPAPENTIPDGWVQDRRPPYSHWKHLSGQLVCGVCDDQRTHPEAPQTQDAPDAQERDRAVTCTQELVGTPDNLADLLRAAADSLAEARTHPHGPPAAGEVRQSAGTACVSLCGGDQDQARTLWKLVAADLGYMPQAAAQALVRAAATTNLVPDVEPPDVS